MKFSTAAFSLFCTPCIHAFNLPRPMFVSTAGAPTAGGSSLSATSDPFADFPSYDSVATPGKVNINTNSASAGPPNANKAQKPPSVSIDTIKSIQEQEMKLKQEQEEKLKQELLKKAKEKVESVTSDTKQKVASSVKNSDKFSSVSEGFKSVKNVKAPTVNLPKVDVQVPSVDLRVPVDRIPKVQVSPPKIPSNVQIPVPPSSIQSLSQDTINTGVGVASASVLSLLALRNSKVAREKKQAEAEEALKKMEEAKKNKIDVQQALDISKDVLVNVDTQVTKVSQNVGEKLKKTLNADADIDEETLGKAVGALGASVVAFGLIVNSGNRGKEVVEEKPILKEDKKESKPVVVKEKEVKVETVKTKATPVQGGEGVEAEVEVVTKKDEPVVEIPKKKEVEVIEKKKEEPVVEVPPTSAGEIVEAGSESPKIDIDMASITSNPLLVAPFAFLALRSSLQNSKSIREREQMNEKTKEFYQSVDEKLKKVKDMSEEVDRDLKNFKNDMD